MLELVLLGGFAAYNMATTHSDDHTSVQGDRKKIGRASCRERV